jgi:hypothetical protein
MKNILLSIITLFLFSCKSDKPKDINLKFSYTDSEMPSNSNGPTDMSLELIDSKKTSNGIEISVRKYVTGVSYFGKARVKNDTLYLDYWININEMEIPSLAVCLEFKYEILEVPYKEIKFNYLGNKYKK